MRRTNPFEPFEPIEPLSSPTQGRPAQGLSLKAGMGS